MHHNSHTLHDAARQKGVKIVHSCGFDSIPSDLGVLLLSRHMKRAFQRQCARIDLLVNEAKGGFSGGSIQSVFAQEAASEDAIRACKDPYCLCPRPVRAWAWERSRDVPGRRAAPLPLTR